MRKVTATVLAVAGLALAAGATEAAERLRTMQVALPDGSVAEIAYAGDVAPRVAVVPADSQRVAASDPFVEMERISAQMQAQHEAMMRQMDAQMAALRQQVQTAAAAGGGAPGQVVVTGNLPAGAHYSYTMVSTSTGGNGCTQTVEWSSDGSGKEPKVTRTSAGDCSAVNKNPPAVQASAPAKPAAPEVKAAAPAQEQVRVPGGTI